MAYAGCDSPSVYKRAKEILDYIHEMADHELIGVCTSTLCQRHHRKGHGFVVNTSRESLVVRAVVFATGVHETTAGSLYWPIDPSHITNGAGVLHSAVLAEGKSTIFSAKTIYVVGASKAAIDALEWMNPDDGAPVQNRKFLVSSK